MPRRLPRALAALSLLALTGCGGPSNHTICVALIAAIPLVHVTLLGVLGLLDGLRGLSERIPGALLRPGLAISGGLLGLSALVLVAAGRPDVQLTLLAYLGYGSFALFVALLAWRLRPRAACVPRVLVASLLGAALGFPSLVLWPASLDEPAGRYIVVLLFGSMFFTLYAAPLLLLGLGVEAVVRRKQEERLRG